MLGTTLTRLEGEAIRDALETHGSIRRAADALGIGYESLRGRIQAYHLRPPQPVCPPPAPVTIPDPVDLDRPFCAGLHRWRLVHRARDRRGITRVWHCQSCPAVRQEGPR